MFSRQQILDYIQNQEETDISYVKVGNGGQHLIVSFGHNGHTGFAQKTSLVDLMLKRTDSDILYLRNQAKWYLGGLKGIGKNINHTISFLKKQFVEYDKIICSGFSSGGYASILFGSLLEVDSVIVVNPQTDLQFIHTSSQTHLTSLVKKCTKTYQKYNNLNAVITENVNYFYYSAGDKNLNGDEDFVLHGDHHYDNIKNCSSVTRIDNKPDVNFIDSLLNQ